MEKQRDRGVVAHNVRRSGHDGRGGQERDDSRSEQNQCEQHAPQRDNAQVVYRPSSDNGGRQANDGVRFSGGEGGGDVDCYLNYADDGNTIWGSGGSSRSKAPTTARPETVHNFNAFSASGANETVGGCQGDAPPGVQVASSVEGASEGAVAQLGAKNDHGDNVVGVEGSSFAYAEGGAGGNEADTDSSTHVLYSILQRAEEEELAERESEQSEGAQEEEERERGDGGCERGREEPEHPADQRIRLLWERRADGNEEEESDDEGEEKEVDSTQTLRRLLDHGEAALLDK